MLVLGCKDRNVFLKDKLVTLKESLEKFGLERQMKKEKKSCQEIGRQSAIDDQSELAGCPLLELTNGNLIWSQPYSLSISFPLFGR